MLPMEILERDKSLVLNCLLIVRHEQWMEPYTQSGPEIKLLQGEMSGKGRLLAKPSGPH